MQDYLRDKTNDVPFGLLVLTLRKQAGLQQQHPLFKAPEPAQRADPREGPPRLRGSGPPSRKDPAADQLSALSSTPFRLRQADRAAASEGASFSGRDLLKKSTWPSTSWRPAGMWEARSMRAHESN